MAFLPASWDYAFSSAAIACAESEPRCTCCEDYRARKAAHAFVGDACDCHHRPRNEWCDCTFCRENLRQRHGLSVVVDVGGDTA